MKKTNENCKGCSSLTVDMKRKLQVCVNIDTGLIDNCPCQSCLVKAVCHQVCDEYMTVFHQDYQWILMTKGEGTENENQDLPVS